MEVEYATKVLTLDDTLQDGIKKLDADGWQLMQGVKPLAVYQLWRPKKVDTAAGVGGMSIDESKVMILRDGKLIPG